MGKIWPVVNSLRRAYLGAKTALRRRPKQASKKNITGKNLNFEPTRTDILRVADFKCSDRAAWGPINPKPKATRKSHLRSRKDKNMSLVINTNYSATIAANNLAYSNSQLQNSLNELSSGSKLTTAASDAGGTALALTLNSQATNDGALIQANANNLASLQTADGALQVAGAILTRMSQLNTLSYGTTGGTSASGSYATEFTALQTELKSFDSSFASTLASDSGAVSSSAIAADIATIATLRASNGASQSVDGFQNTLLTNNQTNAQSQLSTVSDVDVADASTKLAKWNVLVQAGTAMLAQANQSSQLALKLLG